MANVIKLKKGLNINLEGTPEEKFVNVKEAKKVTLVPDDIVMCTPKIVLKAGDAVKAGDEVFHDKQYPEIKFVSPVSGVLEEVVRGDRRKVLGIVISNDGKGTSAKLPVIDPKTATVDEVKQAMLDGGVWPFLTQDSMALTSAFDNWSGQDVVLFPHRIPLILSITSCAFCPFTSDEMP